AGIALMLVSVFLSVFKTDGGERKTSFIWLALSLLAMLFSGLIGVMQKIHQSSEHKGELLAFLIVAFVISAVYSAAAAIYYDKKRDIRCTLDFRPRHQLIWMAAVSGVCIALANQINLYLSGVMESIVFFPVVNGAGLLLSIIASVVFLHERLSKSRWAGIAVGCAAVALLCI
ncbi:MAG: EamA family transporter, partial [Eubacteriales bacterium]